MLKGWDFDQTI